MRIPLPKISSVQAEALRAWHLPGQRTLQRIALGAVVVLAAALRFANLQVLGYGNHYYTAAVVAMLKSWHNFFFVAAEPGGSVTVDKPPVGLWLQTISAKLLGVSGFSVLLPQLLAGVLSVLVLYYLVRRSHGVVAGLLAGLALAITPVAVATDRNNTMDSLLILVLLLAAWAFIKASETGRLRWLLLGAALVGAGFNIKMLQAFLPLPAFYALYLLGSNEGLWRKIGKLALASLLLLVVSLSWVTVVELTPADQRPYVGSSSDNSEINLIIGYNGMNRLLGVLGRRSPISLANRPGSNFRQPGSGQTAPVNPDGNNRQRIPGNEGGFPAMRPGNNNPGVAPGGGNGQPFGGSAASSAARGVSETGRAGALRLLIPPLSKETSWLLPFVLVSILVLLASARPRWPLAPEHQALVLWGGWLLTGGVFFSIAGFFHEYYLAMLAPALAALVGSGAAQLWKFGKRSAWAAGGVLLAAVGGTLGFQAWTAKAFVSTLPWLPLAIICLVAGAVLLAIAAWQRSRYGWLARTGLACTLAAMFITPGVWSALTTLNPSDNQSLPSAYSGRPAGPPNQGGLLVEQDLLDYLQMNTRGIGYLMAVPSSMQGADYVLATGRPVLYIGGFMGMDRVVDAAGLARLVKQGELRYIYWNASNGRSGGGMDIASWVTSACQAVPGFDTITRNMGAPDGIARASGAANNRMNGSLQVSLYDCGGP
ncbi:MAG: glycosyltransferase family 39 protein [Chloroflexota bacterium]